VERLAHRVANGFAALAEHVRNGTTAPLLGTPDLVVDAATQATGPVETVRLVDRQCLLLVRVHDRIAGLPPI
jgi:hypothetical protein